MEIKCVLHNKTWLKNYGEDNYNALRKSAYGD